MSLPLPDALVLGRGPAGLAAAAALAARGLRVASLAPAGPLHWPAEYGAWADEMEEVGLGDAVAHRWPEAVVRLEGEERRVLPRAYVRVDKTALAAELRDRCERGGVRWMDGEAAAAEHGPAHSMVRCRDGREIGTRLVIDASGHRPVLVRRPPTPPQAFQTAYGVTVETEATLPHPGRALLMDWDDAHLAEAARDVLLPTFLYAMPLGERRWFAEETVLVGRPTVPPAVLKLRLRLRLERLGITVRRVLSEERVWIPMGGALPDPRQRVLGFGAAGGMVHPATGYLLARVLGGAPTLARAVADVLGADGGSPARAARAGWKALWPADRRRRHALFCFGMETLLRLDAAGMRDFFRTFFDLPPHDWQGFLGDRLAAPQLAGVMGRFFRRAPPRVRSALLDLGAGAEGARLATRILRAGV